MSSQNPLCEKSKLVSVIIPIYNRGGIIGGTLKSLLKQTYKNWECIVVDDGSTDATLKILAEYTKTDSRIKYYERPESYRKGANSCRNLGFQKSIGEYIIWFDSDDLMTPDHISAKMQKISESNADFVVARTQNFQEGKFLKPYHYEIKEYGIKASDFILLKIHWYTYDVILKREIAEKLEWNEKMKSWQDYNYFCKMLLVTENGVYLDQILTKRRIHEHSIQNNMNKDSETFSIELLENRFLTYEDIQKNIDPETRKELIFGMMNLCVELRKSSFHSVYENKVIKIVESVLGINSKFYFKAALMSAHFFRKYHFFLTKAKKR